MTKNLKDQKQFFCKNMVEDEEHFFMISTLSCKKKFKWGGYVYDSEQKSCFVTRVGVGMEQLS